MLALLNKKKTTISATLSLLPAVSALATQLHLNGSTGLNITGAEYLGVLSDVPVESSVFSDESLVYLDADTNISLDIHSYGAVELFWNGLPLSVTDSDSQWLFVNGLCDEAKELFAFPKPQNWFLVLPGRKCEDYRETDDLVLTFLAIKHQLSAESLSGKQGRYSFSTEKPGTPLNPSFLSPAAMMFDDSGLIPPLKAGQQAFLEYLARYAHREITVFILNTPITRQNLKYTPGGAQMNQIVEDATSEKALLTLISQTMTNLGLIPKKVDVQKALPDFLQRVQSPDGQVNVQLVINYIKTIIRHYNPAINKEHIPETVKQIIMAMVERSIREQAQEGTASSVAGATGISPSAHAVPASAVHSNQIELIEQLISVHSGNANRISFFLFSLFPQLRGVGYREAKRIIRNRDDTISIRGVLTLLKSVDNFEPILAAALRDYPQDEETHQIVRPKKPSSQGPLEKKKEW